MATPVEIIEGMSAEWDAHNLDAVYAHLADDYREYANGALVKVGPAQTRAADQALYDTVKDYRRTVEETWGADDRVASRFTIHGTLPDGSRLSVAVGALYRVANAQIVEAHLYFDTAAN